jgi:hypothetical protein
MIGIFKRIRNRSSAARLDAYIRDLGQDTSLVVSRLVGQVQRDKLDARSLPDTIGGRLVFIWCTLEEANKVLDDVAEIVGEQSKLDIAREGRLSLAQRIERYVGGIEADRRAKADLLDEIGDLVGPASAEALAENGLPDDLAGRLRLKLADIVYERGRRHQLERELAKTKAELAILVAELEEAKA